MSHPEAPHTHPRTPLTRDRILEAAVGLADRTGIEALTIRKLATELDVRPMTLYHHVDGKEAVLDGMIDLVFSEIALPGEDLAWRDAVRGRCLSTREVLVRHPWSVPLMESRRSPGPATLRHHEAMLACFLDSGMSMHLTAHAYAVIDSYVYGFAIQEANVPVQGAAGDEEVTQQISAQFSPDQYPHLVRFAAEHVMRPEYRFGDSFEYGLDLLLAGLEAAAGAERH
jgi:AcrR family transcriptional regulator